MKKPDGILIVRDSVQGLGLRADDADDAKGMIMDEMERARLDAVLTAGKEELARGEVVSLEQVLSEL
jgi:hypothetical protein